MATYLYIGPYIVTECQVGLVTAKVQKCSNSECSLSSHEVQGRFCHKCGKEITTGTIEKEGPLLEVNDIVEKMKRKLYHRYIRHNSANKTQVVFWTPTDTKRQPERTLTWNSSQGAFCEDITQDVIKKEVDWLTEKYAEEIKVLTDQYGSCAIKWGAIAEVA